MASDYPKVYLYRRIVQAKLFIDDNYADDIDLHNIADEACFSKFHFMRLFKKAYNRTPHQYLTYVRMEKAKQLLQTGRAVSDVCGDVGFDSLTSFAGLFKRAVGLTPSAYRLLQMEMKAEMAGTPLKFIPACFAAKKGWLKKSNFEEVGP